MEDLRCFSGSENDPVFLANLTGFPCSMHNSSVPGLFVESQLLSPKS
jgi:hypothetical protein